MGKIILNGTEYAGSGGSGGGSGGHTIVDPNGTDMPQENKLKFTGAVSVSDDAVNGQTVVDVEGGGNYYLNTLYSTEEKKIGYWTDGKPLYEKVVKSTTTPRANAWNTVALPNDISVKIFDAYYVRTTGDVDKFSMYRSNTNPAEMLVCTINNSRVDYQISSQYVANFSEFVVIIQYTKTTDTPELNPQTGGVIYLPTIYSDEEREVGVWRDGKPLYQKTISIASTTIPSGGSVTFSLQTLGIQNAEKIINADGTAMAGTTTVPFNYLNISTNVMYAITLTIEGDALMLGRSQSSSITLTDVYITVQYTKTTDVAGSGSWTPSGAKAVHYSTNEQVIGTWIDGKPLYEKTVSFGALPNSTSKSVAHGISDLDQIVDFSALAKRPSPFNIIPLPSSHYQSTSAQQEISFNATNITIRNGNNASAYTDVYVTLRYTKATD